MKQDITKKDLYEAVKTLVERDEINHFHLPQHKLFTLFSIAFQYLLFRSTKNAGAYIIRIEDSLLADKLARRAKDPSTRKFLQSLLIPRRLKYGKSTFYLDFFHIGSWNFTKDLPSDKVQGALIVKNTSRRPMNDMIETAENEEGEAAKLSLNDDLPKDYFLTSLTDFVPKTITIAYEHDFDGLEPIHFTFIKREQEKTISGVTLGNGIDWDAIEDS